MVSDTQYLQVTPSGAFFATVSSQPDDARALLLQLLSATSPVEYSPELFAELAYLEPEMADKLFRVLLAKRFIALSKEQPSLPDGSLETTLKEVLPTLSVAGRVVLADDQGFCLASSGFDADHADALAALSADMISFHQRHQPLLNNDLQLLGHSWGMLDPVGQSQLGIWMIHVGIQSFALVISDQPCLNKPQFVDLLSALASRYLDH